MKELQAALFAETLKVLKSKIFIITIAFFAFIALILGLMMFVARHPELVERSAMIQAKTSMLGNGDWPALFNLLTQVILALGTIGFGMVAAWVFGREYVDHAVKDLLALPVSRFAIVTAKFIVIAGWCLLLALTFFITAFFSGLALCIPGWSDISLPNQFGVFMGSSALTILLCTPVAFFACLARGYLLPVGFAILTLILTNLMAVGLPGFTPWFPWAVPALWSKIAGSQLPPAGPASYIILSFTCAAGYIATAAWWRLADQK